VRGRAEVAAPHLPKLTRMEDPKVYPGKELRKAIEQANEFVQSTMGDAMKKAKEALEGPDDPVPLKKDKLSGLTIAYYEFYKGGYPGRAAFEKKGKEVYGVSGGSLSNAFYKVSKLDYRTGKDANVKNMENAIKMLKADVEKLRKEIAENDETEQEKITEAIKKVLVAELQLNEAKLCKSGKKSKTQ